MRRAFHRLITTAAVSTVAASLTAPALAESSGGVTGDTGGEGSTIETIATDEGGNDGGGSDDSSTGSGNKSSDPPGSSAESDGNPPAEGSSEPRTESVEPSRTENVGDYSNGPIAVKNPNVPGYSEVDPKDAEFRAPLAPGVTVAENSGLLSSSPDGTAPSAITGNNSGAPAPANQAPQAPAPAQPAAPQVDPAELAQTAVSKMHLKAPEVASTPNDPDTLGAVGLPVWLWVANPGPTTTGPNTTSATAGDVTVTATATFSGMSIDMGDGTTIECDGPGTEYPGTGIEPSPDCGHVYEQMSDDQPGGLYTVNITAHWNVDWEANTGEDGQIPIDLTTSKQLRIGSYQTVVTDVS